MRGARDGAISGGRLAVLSLGALGVVYGDIGTSPLYAMRECFFGPYGVAVSRANVLGVVSLIAWSLILVVSVKYLLFVLRARNQGEGGILALMELVQRHLRGRSRRMILALGLFGAALLYGDGMITPAISVLSAMEGLEVATPVLAPWVIPLTILVLLALFGVQRLGTSGIGMLFGPVMLAWFLVLAATGVASIAGRPEVLQGLNPAHAVLFLEGHGIVGLEILGIVFLAVTGAEALYADVGHFGPGPIRLGWYGVALPALAINYFGQGALILARPERLSNPFYQLVPAPFLYPLVALATLATIIASQAIISGAYSLTFQAFQLGYLPRLGVRHTSARKRGQIYVPTVNWILMASTIGLVLLFRRSGNLAAAYGVAIAATMVLTTLLLHVAMRRVFGWRAAFAVPATLAFLAVDLAFFGASIRKFMDGGWFPLLIGGLVFLLMATWRKGHASERRRTRNRVIPVRRFLQELGGGAYRRVPGQAVYLTDNARGTPHALMHNLRHNRALHSKVVIYTEKTMAVPYVEDTDRLEVTALRSDIHRIVARHGYMEYPDVPEDLAEASRREDLGIDVDAVTYFVGGEILLPHDRYGMSLWRSRLYALMARNQPRATRYYSLPPERVLEIGMPVRV